MPERDKKLDRPSSPRITPRRDDDSNVSREPKVSRPRSDEESTPSLAAFANVARMSTRASDRAR